MGLVTPGIGLIFWMTIAFLIVWVGLGKMALPAILKSLKEREESINDALKSAELAKEEMSKLQASNEALLREAREQRDQMLKEARETRDKVIADAKNKAQEEATNMISAAKAAIETEKQSAVAELKTLVAEVSIDIAEKILKSELSNDAKQKELVSKMIDDIKLN